jgi:hypothetical protein
MTAFASYRELWQNQVMGDVPSGHVGLYLPLLYSSCYQEES